MPSPLPRRDAQSRPRDANAREQDAVTVRLRAPFEWLPTAYTLRSNSHAVAHSGADDPIASPLILSLLVCEYHHINQRGQRWKWESKRSKVKSQNLSRLPSSSSSLHQWSNLSHPSCPHSVTTSSAQTLQQHCFREWSTVFKSN